MQMGWSASERERNEVREDLDRRFDTLESMGSDGVYSRSLNKFKISQRREVQT